MEALETPLDPPPLLYGGSMYQCAIHCSKVEGVVPQGWVGGRLEPTLYCLCGTLSQINSIITSRTLQGTEWS